MQPSSHTANVFNNLKIISGSKWPTSNYTISYIVRIGTFKKLIVANSWYMEHLRSRRRWTTGSATFTDNLYPGKLAPAFARWRHHYTAFLLQISFIAWTVTSKTAVILLVANLSLTHVGSTNQPTSQPTHRWLLIVLAPAASSDCRWKGQASLNDWTQRNHRGKPVSQPRFFSFL